MRSKIRGFPPFSKRITTIEPAVSSPLARTAPKPPSDSARRSMALTRIALVSRASISAGRVAGEARQRNARAHEGAGSPPRFLALGVDQPRLADEDSAPSARPAPFRHHLAAGERSGEEQVEGGGEEKTVGDEAVAGVEGRVVHHLEIER